MLTHYCECTCNNEHGDCLAYNNHNIELDYDNAIPVDCFGTWVCDPCSEECDNPPCECGCQNA